MWLKIKDVEFDCLNELTISIAVTMKWSWRLFVFRSLAGVMICFC